MPDEYKVREYFLRFRNAFKKPMRRIIDMGCPANNRTLEMAKEVALRYQLSTADDDGEATNVETSKEVAFSGAYLHPDRATSLETAVAGINTQLENLSVSMRRINDRLDRFDNRLRALERAPHQSSSRTNNNGDCRNDNRRNDDRCYDDRRNDDRHNDNRHGNNQPRRRNNDCDGNRNRRGDDRDDERDRRNFRDNVNRGWNDHSNRNNQHQESDSADEDSEESVTDDEPLGAVGYSRRN